MKLSIQWKQYKLPVVAYFSKCTTGKSKKKNSQNFRFIFAKIFRYRLVNRASFLKHQNRQKPKQFFQNHASSMKHWLHLPPSTTFCLNDSFFLLSWIRLIVTSDKKNHDLNDTKFNLTQNTHWPQTEYNNNLRKNIKITVNSFNRMKKFLAGTTANQNNFHSFF